MSNISRSLFERYVFLAAIIGCIAVPICAAHLLPAKVSGKEAESSKPNEISENGGAACETQRDIADAMNKEHRLARLASR